MATRMLVTMDRYEQLLRQVAKLEQAAVDTDNLLLDAACRGGLPFTAEDGKRRIDTCALSTWEDVCGYLASRGRLVRVSNRVYEVVEGAGDT